MNPKHHPDDFMVDAQGRHVPVANIDEYACVTRRGSISHTVSTDARTDGPTHRARMGRRRGVRGSVGEHAVIHEQVLRCTTQVRTSQSS